MKTISDGEYFPAIKEDLGAFLKFLCLLKKPKKIFEFGSGYGQSAFWYLLATDSSHTADSTSSIEKIYLTEIKERLWEYYDSLPWPDEWQKKIYYYKGDAFKAIDVLKVEEIDLVFMDGQKARYLDFFKKIESKLNKDAIIIVDNIFWKGNILKNLNNNSSFNNEEINEEIKIKEMSYPSVKGIESFYNYITNSSWYSIFFPYYDGVLLLYK
ncbi:MAG: class I SAM-dependent methyltransferase [Oligoflexia bacterium]|nr:class I SAM-dependent methyltransferase [Oligoflexia bacterium]